MQAELRLQIEQMERRIGGYSDNLRRIRAEIKDPQYKHQVPELRGEYKDTYDSREAYRKAVAALRASATQLDVTLVTGDTCRRLAEITQFGKSILDAGTVDGVKRAVEAHRETEEHLEETGVLMEEFVRPPPTEEATFTLAGDESEEDLSEAQPLMFPPAPTHVPKTRVLVSAT